MSLARWRVPAILALLAIAIGSFGAAESLRYAPALTQVTVNAVPITSFDNRDPQQVRFGALEFRGGLALTSQFEAFGGISGLRMDADGQHFLAITDNGSWLRGRIVYKDGKPAGIADTEMAPLLAADGKPLAARGWFDIESLTNLGDKTCVGIERVHEIVCFDAKDGLTAHGTPIATPPAVKKLPFNQSIEGLIGVPQGQPLAGTLIVFSERGLDSAGNILCFLIGGPRPGQFTVKRKGDFDISDAVLLPGGDILLLERAYSPATGVAMRIRRVTQASIAPGAVVDGQTLIEADLGYQIDNMEGIGVHRAANGEVILTLVSDDNFSVLQRTLLLQFALVE